MSSFIQGTILPFASGLNVNIVHGSGVGPRPCLVYLHGGGWSHGSHLNMPPTLVDVINKGVTVISVQYTLSNVAKFPQQIYDIKGAIRWIRANATILLNIDPNKIGIGGESAGGHLAMLTAYTNNNSSFEGSVGGNLSFASHVKCVVNYSGPTDISSVLGDFTMKPLIDWSEPRSGLSLLIGGFPKASGVTNTLIVSASPINHVSSGTVPTFIAHASKDAVIPVAQATKLIAVLTVNGAAMTTLIFDGDNHGWQMPVAVDELRTKFLLRHLR